METGDWAMFVNVVTDNSSGLDTTESYTNELGPCPLVDLQDPLAFQLSMMAEWLLKQAERCPNVTFRLRAEFKLVDPGTVDLLVRRGRFSNGSK